MKKIIVAIASVAVVVMSLAGCTSVKEVVSSVTGQKIQKNVLTDLPGTNGTVLAVKIDDTQPAHPQIGVDAADVVYIEQVEGGLTRLAAIFSNPHRLPDLIGPVRSARISDIEILAQYGKVAFAFSGAQTKLYPVINSANLYNLGAEREPASIYSRDLTRVEPTNLILHPQDLLDKAESEGAQISTASSVGWSFGDAPVGGREISSVSFKWPASRYGATWSATEKRWLLSYLGSPNLDAHGKQLGSPTLIIQKVSITPSEYHDKVGGVTPFSNTVGSGSAYLLRDGKSFPIYWNRVSPEVGTTWTLKDGSPAHFAPGQIWIALVDNEPVFTYPPVRTSTPAPSKSK
ncbi:MAG: hypothetical protein RL414_482 [Actinomycetota bacterium]